MKKWLLVVVFFTAFCLVPTHSYAKFPDVNYNTEMGRAIDFLQSEDIIRGFPDGTFQPYRLVTRGQAAKMMSAITHSIPISYHQDTAVSSSFKDVATTHEYFDPIHALYEYNVISGYEDGTFRMQQNINRAQLAKMISHAFVLQQPTTSVNFTDIARTNERFLYANRVYAARIMPYNPFKPNASISRGEMALFLYRAYMKVEADFKQAQTLTPFIGTNTTLGQAFSDHPFMKEGIRQQMPIAAFRQSRRNLHYFSGYEMPYPCSFMRDPDGNFMVCYEDGSDGNNGIVTAFLYNKDEYSNQIDHVIPVEKLLQALGSNSFTIDAITLENGEIMHRGYTKNPINGLYYGFSAIGGTTDEPKTITASLVTHMSVSIYPTIIFY